MTWWGRTDGDRPEGLDGRGRGGQEETSLPVHSVFEPERTEPRFADVMEPEWSLSTISMRSAFGWVAVDV